MWPPYSDAPPSELDRGREDGRGNIVVSGLEAFEHLQQLGMAVRFAPDDVAPEHTDTRTRAIVVVSRNADEAVKRADLLREWAHESLLPLIAVVLHVEDVEDPALWERALTCAHLGDDAHVLRLLCALDRERMGLPTQDDAQHCWELRRQLRNSELTGLGVGLDAFVVDSTAFVGGLLRPGTPVSTLEGALRLPAGVRLNTDGLRTAGARP